MPAPTVVSSDNTTSAIATTRQLPAVLVDASEVLVVVCSMRDATDTDRMVSILTWGAQDLVPTEVGTQDDPSIGHRYAMHYLLPDSTDTRDIDLTCGGECNRLMMGYWIIAGVDKDDVIDVFGGSDHTASTSKEVTLTTVKADTLILGVLGSQSVEDLVPTAPGIEDWEDQISQRTTEAQHWDNVAPGAHEIQVTHATSQGGSTFAASFNAAPATGFSDLEKGSGYMAMVHAGLVTPPSGL